MQSERLQTSIQTVRKVTDFYADRKVTDFYAHSQKGNRLQYKQPER